MRYFYEKPDTYTTLYGETYICPHPAYVSCTLYLRNGLGLGVIQQRYDCRKRTYWTCIDPWLVDELYLNSEFTPYFNKYASLPTGNIYPVVTIRQIMWALHMKPIKREPWETVFDKCPIR